MRGRLENKIALITGIGGGMGRGAVLRFVREGAKVVGAPHGIRVAAVSPGFTVTPSTQWLVDDGPHEFKEMLG